MQLRWAARRGGVIGRAGAGLLVIALLTAQSFALLHGVVHGGHGSLPVHATHAGDHHPADHSAGDAGQGHAVGALHESEVLADAVIERLFGTHQDDVDCRLYDQLGHADAAPLPMASALPLSLPAVVFDFLSGEFVARRAALFQARGPPCVR
ncbi:MAG: hypothetical protein Q8K38_10085 [Burkholderiaceae bacterium]|nr:hypothetical protein [Burkholderiaceae bacterium]MDZ4144080.1 hypothetical protein [Burkholderiales bacterium]